MSGRVAITGWTFPAAGTSIDLKAITGAGRLQRPEIEVVHARAGGCIKTAGPSLAVRHHLAIGVDDLPGQGGLIDLHKGRLLWPICLKADLVHLDRADLGILRRRGSGQSHADRCGDKELAQVHR